MELSPTTPWLTSKSPPPCAARPWILKPPPNRRLLSGELHGLVQKSLSLHRVRHELARLLERDLRRRLPALRCATHIAVRLRWFERDRRRSGRRRFLHSNAFGRRRRGLTRLPTHFHNQFQTESLVRPAASSPRLGASMAARSLSKWIRFLSAFTNRCVTKKRSLSKPSK